jgi:hypothetical protein
MWVLFFFLEAVCFKLSEKWEQIRMVARGSFENGGKESAF